MIELVGQSSELIDNDKAILLCEKDRIQRNNFYALCYLIHTAIFS